MITGDAARLRSGGALVASALLASAVVNLAAWILAPWLGDELRRNEPVETIAVRTTHVRILKRPPPTPTPVPTTTPKPRPPKPIAPRYRPHAHAVAAAPVNPPMTATVSLPKNWQTTYMGSARVNDRDIKMWLDWSNQSAEFVPRVYLWHRDIDALDPREVSLRDEVNTVLAQLKDEGGARFYANRAARVCNGRYPGWFLSYDKTDAEPKVHIDDMLMIAHGQIYRATYVRTLDEKEDPKTQAALESLC
jgi:hypothetical protein